MKIIKPILLLTAICCMALIACKDKKLPENAPNKENFTQQETEIPKKGRVKRQPKEISRFPDEIEISTTKLQLPMMVDEVTQWIDVNYDDKTKVETFDYKIISEVDESKLTEDMILDVKKQILKGLILNGKAKRLKAGLKYVYVYYTRDNKKLFEITIDADDLR